MIRAALPVVIVIVLASPAAADGPPAPPVYLHLDPAEARARQPQAVSRRSVSRATVYKKRDKVARKAKQRARGLPTGSPVRPVVSRETKPEPAAVPDSPRRAPAGGFPFAPAVPYWSIMAPAVRIGEGFEALAWFRPAEPPASLQAPARDSPIGAGFVLVVFAIFAACGAIVLASSQPQQEKPI